MDVDLVGDLIAYLDPLLTMVSSQGADPSLTEGPMPETPDNCIAITHYAGEADDNVMGGSLKAANLETARIQVMVRHTSNAFAKAWAQTVHGVLNNLQEYTAASGVRYKDVQTIDGRPFGMGQDKPNLRWRRGCNYRVRFCA